MLWLHFADGSTDWADELILAIPCSTLRDVLIQDGLIPADQLALIKTLQYGTNSKIVLPILAMDDSISSFSNAEEVAVWFNRDRTVATLYTGGRGGLFDATDPACYAEQLAPVQALIPKLVAPASLQSPPDRQCAQVTQALAVCWAHEPYSKGSYSSWAPGQAELMQRRAHSYGEPVRHAFRPTSTHIFFAGEHTALEFPATLEGAVESGERTARMLHRKLQSISAEIHTSPR